MRLVKVIDEVVTSMRNYVFSFSFTVPLLSRCSSLLISLLTCGPRNKKPFPVISSKECDLLQTAFQYCNNRHVTRTADNMIELNEGLCRGISDFLFRENQPFAEKKKVPYLVSTKTCSIISGFKVYLLPFNPEIGT